MPSMTTSPQLIKGSIFSRKRRNKSLKKIKEVWRSKERKKISQKMKRMTKLLQLILELLISLS